jgi:glycosyltransferase involved in cell wall biosynthesis/spore maturation protein CgeB
VEEPTLTDETTRELAQLRARLARLYWDRQMTLQRLEDLLRAHQTTLQQQETQWQAQFSVLSHQHTTLQLENNRLQAQLRSLQCTLAEAQTTHQTALAEGQRIQQLHLQQQNSLETQNHQQQDTISALEAQLASAGQELSQRLVQQAQQHGHLEAQWKAQLAEAQQRARNVRATLSFQLGQAIIFGFQSWAGCWALPGRLWNIRQQARARRAKPLTEPPLQAAAHLTSPVCAQATPPPPPPAPRCPPQTLAAPVTAETLRNLRVAAILDPFSAEAFAPECQCLHLLPTHWETQLRTFSPQLLLVESAWRGKNDAWRQQISQGSGALRDIVAWCQQRGIPTVFWNKEDPTHFDTFLSTAAWFDVVMTTDFDCIPRYKAALDHTRVYLLPFAAQVSVYHPIETPQQPRQAAVCFAGAYYARYPERTRDLDAFLAHLPTLCPVDIYDRSQAPDVGQCEPAYHYPDAYQRFLVGHVPHSQMADVYKRYAWALNLNSIKHSQTMVARRVFDLLASNTLTLSNDARGLWVLLGNTVLATDHGPEAVAQLRALSPQAQRKQRLSGLRRVLQEHTMQDRLATVVEKAYRVPTAPLLPTVHVLAFAPTIAARNTVLENYARQLAPKACLGTLTIVVSTTEDLGENQPPSATPLRQWTLAEAQHLSLAALGFGPENWVAVMCPQDAYGPHYLQDMVLATRFATRLGSSVVGKGSFYRRLANTDDIFLEDKQPAYQRVAEIDARRGLAQWGPWHSAVPAVKGWTVSALAKQLETLTWRHGAPLSLDVLNYCQDAGASFIDACFTPPAAPGQEGVTLSQLMAVADALPPAPLPATEGGAAPAYPYWPAKMLAKLFPAYSLETSNAANEDTLLVQAGIPPGEHRYVWANETWPPEALGADDGHLPVHLSATGTLGLHLVLRFLDAHGQRLGHVLHSPNQNHDITLPPGTARLELGLRLAGQGVQRVQRLLWGHAPEPAAPLIVQGRLLLLSNHYPQYDDLYRNAFVHRRVRGYQQRGEAVTVFRFRPGQARPTFHTFEGVACITGGEAILGQLLATHPWDAVFVHFLDAAMAHVLRHKAPPETRVVVWLHGAEVQPYHRRWFQYQDATAAQRQTAMARSTQRMAFWRALLTPTPPPHWHLVFVSHYFAQEVASDLNCQIPTQQQHVIPNPIDTELFTYQAKPPEQRLKILSIRPYTSTKYANDLAVSAILTLSKLPWFHQLHVLIVGEGPLFEQTLAPLRGLSNVEIQPGFLTQPQIARLHRDYGVFLCPTRMDAQGVSRDEAMASGLVPVTNAVAAIPEFVDDTCGCLAPPEDADALAEAISQLYHHPALFMQLSEAAARRVRQQSDSGQVVEAELALRHATAVTNDTSVLRQNVRWESVDGPPLIEARG